MKYPTAKQIVKATTAIEKFIDTHTDLPADQVIDLMDKTIVLLESEQQTIGLVRLLSALGTLRARSINHFDPDDPFKRCVRWVVGMHMHHSGKKP